MKKIKNLISNTLDFLVEEWYNVCSILFFSGSAFAGASGEYLAWAVLIGFGTVLSAAGLIINKLNFIEETQDREISRNIQKEWQERQNKN